MSLTLSYAQVAELQAKRDANDYAGAYDLMETWSAGSTDPDVQLVHTWLLGAGDINRGEGPFAALVLAYNQRQGLLRGRPVSEAENQGASNKIAQLILDEAISSSAIPTFARIVEFDAEGGASLYNHLPDGDTAKAQAANWTGTFLISPFGKDETGRLLSVGAPTALDTLDDLKNVLFAHDAFKAAIWGMEETVPTWNSFLNAFLAGATLPENERLSEAVTGVGPNWTDNLITDMMAGRVAESAFALVRSLDQNDTLDQLMSAWQGQRVSGTTDESFVTTASTFFNGIAAAAQRNTALERLYPRGSSTNGSNSRLH